MPKYLKGITIDSNPNINENNTGKKRNFVKAGFSGVTTKGISFRVNTNPQIMKPFDLLEELQKLGHNESLTRDEKNNEIKKMLEKE